MKLLRITALVITLALGGYAQAEALNDAVAKPYAAPEFEGVAGWLNSKPLTMSALKGKVVLIDFWTYSCINCLRTLPYINRWYDKYHEKGLVIIGVHTPEFEFEKSEANVKTAIAKYGIHYPIALDSHLAVWNAYANHYWPAHYLIDQNGAVVSTHFGEGHYAETEQNIRNLLGLPPEEAMKPDPSVSSKTQTPETYLGSARAASYSGNPALKDGQGHYQFPVFLPMHHWALEGDWAVESEKITATSANASLRINFQSKQVFLVLGSATGKPITAKVKLNGQPLNNNTAGHDGHHPAITIDKHRLYSLVSQSRAQNSLLEIAATEPGLEAYAFTFGN